VEDRGVADDRLQVVHRRVLDRVVLVVGLGAADPEQRAAE
jgi:hypothetical protein